MVLSWSTPIKIHIIRGVQDKNCERVTLVSNIYIMWYRSGGNIDSKTSL